MTTDTAEGALLAYLSEADRAYLLGLGVRRSFGAKEFVLLQGDPSDHVQILISGWVRVSAVVEDGREVLYALRGPGDVLGDIAAVAGLGRTAWSAAWSRSRWCSSAARSSSPACAPGPRSPSR